MSGSGVLMSNEKEIHSHTKFLLISLFKLPKVDCLRQHFYRTFIVILHNLNELSREKLAVLKAVAAF